MKRSLAAAISVMTVIGLSVSSFAADTINRGTRGDEVKEIQEVLISQGYLDGSADGVFGPKTEAAVKAFQEDYALDVTGIVGAGTLNALQTASEAGEAAEALGEAVGEAVAGAEEAAEEIEGLVGEVEGLFEEEDAAEELDLEAVFPSWNADSESLAELIEFVEKSTDESSPDYIEPVDRIAVFDMDGTIICEKAPIYIDWCMCMYRVLDDPTYEATEEEKAVMQEIRDRAYSEGATYHPEEGLSKDDIVSLAFAGMTPEEFRTYMQDFAASVDAVGFSGMTYGESFYKPMIEVIAFLKANNFDVWMVSACEREVVRALCPQFDIPLDHIIATDVPYVASGKPEDEEADEYNMSQDDIILLGTPLDPVECGKSGKPAAIAREIGRRPVLAFGNSSGDFSMLNYAESNPDHPGMGCFVVCDDTVREYGSDEKAADFYNTVAEENWTAFSMANDWKTIYGEGVEKTGLPLAEEALEEAA